MRTALFAFALLVVASAARADGVTFPSFSSENHASAFALGGIATKPEDQQPEDQHLSIFSFGGNTDYYVGDRLVNNAARSVVATDL
jgi:hypothetical protein